MAEDGVGEEEMAKTEVHHHPSMPMQGPLRPPLGSLLHCFNMVADGKSLPSMYRFDTNVPSNLLQDDFIEDNVPYIEVGS
ncbi:hypothetical protein QJS10_CPB20g00567 [Acorus calamus]|uniref:Uncharacterized protein n=1 Tax=Acorus calamus TaxID=4465 RepID=A0AAV9CBF6_ACOCL|nr:hypothetical protein QJS10_CPB20g00567 [Acorus calamus]